MMLHNLYRCRVRKLSLVKFFSSLPQHLVVGLPSLSPTMTIGSISKWEKKVGDKCSPGDSIGQLETDKASMSFDAQDEFYIAKFLVEEGQEVAVGSPIMITVEDADAVSAFANYVQADIPAVVPPPTATAAVVEKPLAPKATESPKAPAPAPVVKQEAVIPSPPTPAPVSRPVQPPPQAKPTATATPSKVPWGTSIQSSPLLFRLSKLQSDYTAKYGFSGHAPLEVPKKEKKDKKA